MSLPILTYFDPRLRKQAQTVTCFSSELKALVSSMFETMYSSNGIGLASTQIDRSESVVVIDISSERNQPLALVNPSFSAIAQSEIILHEEGCLSIPGIYASVPRFREIDVYAQDLNGKNFHLKAEGLLSCCIQHELDHLKGTLFVDYLSPLKRSLLEKKLKKQLRYISKEASISTRQSRSI